MNRQQLAALEDVFEAIPELEFDEMASWWPTHPAGADAEPIPELEFDRTFEL